MSIVNLAVYKFFRWPEYAAHREGFRAACAKSQLKGTILLSPEGINCFLAGSRAGIDAFLQELRVRTGIQEFHTKESFSETVPFTRMLVKLKNEIIPLGDPTLRPDEDPAPFVKPLELKRWLDEGKDVVLLDTRNDYEYRLGSFKDAVLLPLQHFRKFGEGIAKLPADVKKRRVVTFCTGGIRCEKAAPYLLRQGFEDVYQLEGGILDYFKEAGGAHYQGECFVFDRRVALDFEQKPTKAKICYNCLQPLTEEDQKSPHYRIRISCPFCVSGKKEQTHGASNTSQGMATKTSNL
jgi:UPF0176 protein